MTDTKARNIVAVLWGVLFLVAMVVPFRMYWIDWLGSEWLEKVLEQVNRSYVPYLGALVAFYFVTKKGAGHKHIAVSATVVAILCALVWNGLNLFFLFSLWGGKIEADAAIHGMDKYSSMLSWIVAPGMGYFFGSVKAAE